MSNLPEALHDLYLRYSGESFTQDESWFEVYKYLVRTNQLEKNIKLEQQFYMYHSKPWYWKILNFFGIREVPDSELQEILYGKR
jgi:hypothetical protein